MYKLKHCQTNKDILKRYLVIIITAISIISFSVYSCGGGVVPYVPAQSGTTSSSSGQFFLMEKGVATDMFDVKKLQPLFRNIVLSGNERKEHKSLKQRSKEEKNSRKITDSTNVSFDEEPLPVLNLHRLH